MKATLSGFLCVGLTSLALFGACSSDSGGKSDDDDDDQDSGGEGGGDEPSGGSGGKAQGGAGGKNTGGGGSGSGGGGTAGGGGVLGGSGGGGANGGSTGAAMNPLIPAPTVELVTTIPVVTAAKSPPVATPDANVGSEGPVWVAAMKYLLFSDQANGHDNMFKLDPTKPEATRAEIFPYKLGPTRPKTNGLTVDKDGNVFVCEAIPGQITKFKPTATGAGTVEVVADKFEGAALGKVNDVIVSKKGIVYFTSAWNGPSCESPMNAAYFVSDKMVKKIVAYDMTKPDGIKNPNGVALSPDERTLYVGDDGCYSDLTPGAVYKYPINDDGSVGAGTKFVPEIIVADGITTDDAGNVYIASNHPKGKAVRVFKPDGQEWGKITLPADAGNPSNVSFGDDDRKTLYMTVAGKIYKTKLPIAGAP